MTIDAPEIREVDPQGEDALALLRDAAIEARELYPDVHGVGDPWPTNSATPDRGVYLVVYGGGESLAMAAHRPLDRCTTELRRMFVRRSARGQGLARMLVRHLEDHAARQGFRRMVLETGKRQAPAISLYESCGYRRIAPFGDHLDDPLSICFEKRLEPAP